MTSSMEPEAPLKKKISLVKCLLEDANNRLQEEATKYEIFTTKTSASATTNAANRDASIDLYRTISDINTLKSVLSCPIFNRIVNVTDSLDKLSYQSNLHPSIGPDDINIDSNGELILASPIEPTSLNNIINSKLDSYSDQSNNHSPQIVSPKSVCIGTNNVTLVDHQTIGQPNSPTFKNVYVPQDQVAKLIAQHETQQRQAQGYIPTSTMVSSLNAYDTEKLVSNGNCETYANSTKQKRHSNNNNNNDIKTNIDSNQEETCRLYKSNGHFQLDQVVPGAIDLRDDFQSTQSMRHIGEQLNEQSVNQYPYEMYKTAQELYQHKDLAIEGQQPQSVKQNAKPYISNSRGISMANTKQVQSIQSSVQYNRGSCSPSTSAGSTVRLADECDSGASSYQSHTTKGTPTAEQVTDAVMTSETKEDKVESMEHDLIESGQSSEMERIKVLLEKDVNGLGITVAGYTCEKEEISGIFIRDITPGSPADRTGKIRVLDQIFAVNGRELLGYSNEEAVNVLRNTGKVVTLELMRYLAESKYRKLKNALAHAIPSINSKATNNSENVPRQVVKSPNSNSSSPSKSSLPVSKARDHSQSPTKAMSPPIVAKSTLVQVSNSHKTQPTEAIYKNDQVVPAKKATALKHSASMNYELKSASDVPSHIPVAAQRGGTNKVIETKQGARNTIDIRSPVHSAVTQRAYVDRSEEMNLENSAQKSIGSRLQKELTDNFGPLNRAGEPEWEKEAEIIELYKDPAQGLGFTVKEYANPKNQRQTIIMITYITEGGIAEIDGRLSSGDLLVSVDDTNLDGASSVDTVKALKRASGYVKLGILKLKR